MVTIIPQKDKKFSVDNSSFSRGNIYGTFNIMFDADIGKIKLNPPLLKLYSTTDSADFVSPFASVVAQKNGGGGVDCYVLTDDTVGSGTVWSVAQGALTKLTGSNAPALATDASSDMALAWNNIHVSTSSGLHYIPDSTSAGVWTLNADAAFQSKYIVIFFSDQNRLYFFNSSSVKSCTSGYVVSSGSFEITSGLSNISCARASSKRIWFGSSGANGAGKARIYEWDGVATNPLNIFTIDTPTIQSIVILNDIPIAIDGRGRLWFYDGYNFVLKPGINIPAREDDFNTVTCTVHRNGTFSDKGKVFVLISSAGSRPNTSERALSGVWCYDPLIGLYHFSSPDNNSRITNPYVLAPYVSDNRMIAGYFGGSATLGNSNSRISVTESATGISGSLRTGFITTQFIESQNLTDMFNSIAIKYRDMIYTSAQIEVKYRTKKNLECNTTITWTANTTFTCSTADLAGTGANFNTQVAVGDEVMIQQGSGVVIIAHVVSMVDNAGTTTVTIDRSSGVTSGTAYAMFSNYTLLKTISYVSGDIFKNVRLGKATTMIQVKLVMQWKGYYDEIQEILLDGNAQQKTT